MSAAAAAAAAADRASEAAARAVGRATGGQGGTVLLIVGVLYTGYLFLSGRLKRVLEAIAAPGPFSAPEGTGGTPPPVPGPSPVSPSMAELLRRARRLPPGGTPPIVPGETPGYDIQAVDPYAECLLAQIAYWRSQGKSPAEAERRARAKCRAVKDLPSGRFL